MSKSKNEIKITIINFLKKGNPVIAKLKKNTRRSIFSSTWLPRLFWLN